MKKQDFKIGMRVHHPDYGDGTVRAIEPTSYRDGRPIGIQFDAQPHRHIWPLDYDLCTPIDPEFKYGEEVECCNDIRFPVVYVFLGYYGFPNSDGGHWIKIKDGDKRKMILINHVRRPVVTPITAREKLMNQIAISFNAGDSLNEIMIHVDNYVERILAEARETWEKENPRLIWPEWNDITDAPKKYGGELEWLKSDAGQQWLKERKEVGK